MSRHNLMMALAAMCIGGILPETADVPPKPEPRKPRDKSNIDDAIAIIEANDANAAATAIAERRIAAYGNHEVTMVANTNADTTPRRLPMPKSEYDRKAAEIREENARRKALNFRKRLPKGHPDRIES